MKGLTKEVEKLGYGLGKDGKKGFYVWGNGLSIKFLNTNDKKEILKIIKSF